MILIWLIGLFHNFIVSKIIGLKCGFDESTVVQISCFWRMSYIFIFENQHTQCLSRCASFGNSVVDLLLFFGKGMKSCQMALRWWRIITGGLQGMLTYSSFLKASLRGQFPTNIWRELGTGWWEDRSINYLNLAALAIYLPWLLINLLVGTPLPMHHHGYMV